MSWWHFDYIEYNLTRLAEEYEYFNKKWGNEYSDLKQIPKRVIKVLYELWNITHEIDRDLSWDSSIKEWYFDKAKKRLNKILDT